MKKWNINARLSWDFIFLFAILLGSFLVFWGEVKSREKTLTPTTSTISVEVTGAVKKPGIFEVKEGALVEDVLKMAEPLKEADLTKMKVSLKTILLDGQKIYVPFKNEKIAGVAKININTASKEELERLPFIGSTLAQRIIEYREKKPFSTIDEIKNVKGIGEKIFSQIEDLICVE